MQIHQVNCWVARKLSNQDSLWLNRLEKNNTKGVRNGRVRIREKSTRGCLGPSLCKYKQPLVLPRLQEAGRGGVLLCLPGRERGRGEPGPGRLSGPRLGLLIGKVG